MTSFPETRYNYSDGTRKLYDRNKMPEGLDEDIWHLVLYFEDVAESYDESIVARPIAYTELRHRIHTSGIRNKEADWVGLVKFMIDLFWQYERDVSFSINNFCNLDKFEYYMDYAIDVRNRYDLVEHGNRVPQPDREMKPSRSTEDEAKIRKILIGKNEETDLLDKMRKFKDR